ADAAGDHAHASFCGGRLPVRDDGRRDGAPPPAAFPADSDANRSGRDGGAGMKSSVVAASLPLARSRLADLVELTKPRIAVLVLFTVGAGALLATNEVPDVALLVNTILATGLLAAGASVLNQVMERQSDGLMRRTENRPLPAGRLHPLEG